MRDESPLPKRATRTHSCCAVHTLQKKILEDRSRCSLSVYFFPAAIDARV